TTYIISIVFRALDRLKKSDWREAICNKGSEEKRRSGVDGQASEAESGGQRTVGDHVDLMEPMGRPIREERLDGAATVHGSHRRSYRRLSFLIDC
ncbi:hypothetical protein PFISCL1PPCAC_21738, partial [Pristionchus fissidentatus]